MENKEKKRQENNLGVYKINYFKTDHIQKQMEG
jgi:hypothetical protein